MADRLADAVAHLGELIAFPTVSRDGNLELIARCSDFLGHLGARTRVSVDPTGAKANLVASFGPERDGGILLSGHSDVVPADETEWTSDPFRLAERDGRLHGRGACDMKGFIACVLATAPRIAETPLAEPVHIALTYDEETGCLGARALVEEMAADGPRPRLAVVGEPTSMRIVEAHKGCCEYTTEFHGLEGHGSAPERGVNAAEAAIRYAARLLALAEELKARAPADSPFDPPHATLNIGRISGGVAHNVIAGQCALDWETRPVRWSDRAFVLDAIDAFAEGELLPAMRAVCAEADIRRVVIGEVEGLEPAAENEARRIVAALTGANGAETAAFGTEAGLFQSLGMDVVVCGPGDIAQAHKPDEWVAPEQLAACLGMLDGLAGRVAA